MDSIQRVKLALTHKQPDRVPLDIGGTRVSGIHSQAYQNYRKEMGLPATNPRMMVRHLQLPDLDEDFKAQINVDIGGAYPITANEEGDIHSDESGESYVDRYHAEWFMSRNASYFDIRRFPLAHAETVADVESYPWPKDNSRAILDTLEQQAESVWSVDRRAVVLGRTCPGIFEMLHFLCGYEKALTDIGFNPELSECIMDRVLQQKLDYYAAAIEIVKKVGLDYFIINESDDLGTQQTLLISPAMYRRMIKPRHTQLFNAIKKMSDGRAFIELHCCGAIREIIPDLIESGVEVLNPIQVGAQGMDDTRSLKKDFGDAMVFHGGGVDTQNTLACGTPQNVRDEVFRRMDDLSPGGGFIFTPVHSIQHDVPYENFAAMMQAFSDYNN